MNHMYISTNLNMGEWGVRLTRCGKARRIGSRTHVPAGDAAIPDGGYRMAHARSHTRSAGATARESTPLGLLVFSLLATPAFATWTPLALDGERIESLSSNGVHLFAITREGAFESPRTLWRIPIDDPGSAEIVWDSETSPVWTVRCHPLAPDTVYLGLAGVFPVPAGPVQRSVDGGATFQRYDDGFCEIVGGVRVLEVTASSPAFLLAAGEGGPHVSESVGTWTPIQDPVGCACEVFCSTIAAAARSVSDPDVLWLSIDNFGATRRLYRSVDGGSTWELMRDDIGGRPFANVIIDPNDPNRVYVGDIGYAERTVNGGDTWAEMPAPFGALGLAVDVAVPAIIYAASYFPPSYPHASWSPSYGVTWNSIDVTGLPPDDDQTVVAADPVRQGLLFLGFTESGIYMTQVDVSSVAVSEPDRVPPPVSLRVHPNPFAYATWIGIRALGGAHVNDARVLNIYDVAGRRVRQLTIPAGGRGTSWDGRLADARELPPGVYVIALAGADASAAIRVTKLR